MTQYYPLRRVPHTANRTQVLGSLRPLVWPILRSVGWSVAGKVVRVPTELSLNVQDKAVSVGDEALEAAQRIYFDNPGLDTMTVRFLTRIGLGVARAGQLHLLVRIALGLDRDGRLRSYLERMPRTGYDSLMVGMLAGGTALGYFRGGRVDSLIWWDSADPENAGRRKLPPHHPYPGVRRFDAPKSLGDMAADIDDLYWAAAYGQAIKVTRVGEGRRRRWLVSLPGTDHAGPESEPNTADLESNIREELNLPSAMRLGTIAVIRSAMASDGIDPEDMVSERVLICGHSQGGMVAVGLAAADPKEVGFTVDGVITLGSPTRRLRVRSDVKMLAFEHDQDTVPSLDATPRREADQRVVVKRKLNRPRKAPLFYAHSSSTYTETLRKAELRQSVAPWGRAGEAFAELSDYLPKEGEETRVTHHYIWQEILEPTRSSAWAEYLEIDPPESWRPVTYEGQIVVPQPRPLDPRALVLAAESKLAPARASEESSEPRDSDD